MVVGYAKYADTLNNGLHGAFALGKFVVTGGMTQYNDTAAYQVDFNAAKSTPIYGASNTVQPASLLAQYLIKY